MIIGQEITIIGAGIGGLTAAVALAAHGAKVRVLEQASEISELGAGIQISPNGARVLLALGLDAAPYSMQSKGVRLKDGISGRDVLKFDFESMVPDAPFLLFHRADLIELLRLKASAFGVDVCCGVCVEDIEPQAGLTRLKVKNEPPQDCDFVIGADGLHSVARAKLNDSSAPFFTGQTAWRSVVPALKHDRAAATVYMGPGAHIVSYPLRQGKLMNLVCVKELKNWTEEGWQYKDTSDNLRSNFTNFCPDVQALLKRVKTVHRWGLHRHPVAQNWHLGRCAILGDAAHSTLPFMAQGAVMALEDGFVLARCLARHGLDAGPAIYQNLRHKRCAQIVEAANNNARNYHYSNPVARSLGHAGMRLAGKLAPELLFDRFRWIYDADVTAS